MPSDWQTIAGAAKTLEDEFGLAPGKARQFVIEAVARHRLPTRWMAEDDPVRIERLRLAPGESLRVGVTGDPETTFVLPVVAAGRKWIRPSRKTHRWGTALVHVPAILALAQESPEACCKMAEAALPEHLREPPPPEEVAQPDAEPAGATPPPAADDDRQRRIDAWMLDYLTGYAQRGEDPPKRDSAIADCRSATGATWREAYDARMRAPKPLRGKEGRPSKKQQ